MCNIILAWISSVKKYFFSAKSAKVASVFPCFPCEISQRKSWDFLGFPENHSQEFLEIFFCANLHQHSFSGLYSNRNRLKLLGNS